MCYFLQSQVWREGTEETISRLSSSSATVVKSLEDSSKLQESILEQQKESLEQQKQIALNGTILSKAIETSKANVAAMLSEFKSSTDEQRTMIFEIFERVTRLQNLVVSEVSWLYTVVFYGSCLFVVYLGTATKRTGEARIWLYLVLTINFLLERTICNLSLPNSDNEALNFDNR